MTKLKRLSSHRLLPASRGVVGVCTGPNLLKTKRKTEKPNAGFLSFLSSALWVEMWVEIARAQIAEQYQR